MKREKGVLPSVSLMSACFGRLSEIRSDRSKSDLKGELQNSFWFNKCCFGLRRDVKPFSHVLNLSLSASSDNHESRLLYREMINSFIATSSDLNHTSKDATVC